MQAVSDSHAYRASLLWFPDPDSDQIHFETDGLLVTTRGADGVARISAIGDHRTLETAHAHLPLTDWRGHWIAPGFVDTHIHYAQTDVIASPADGLLPWLNNYTFPQETRFADPAHASAVAAFFFDELMRHGVTTAHSASVDAFFTQAQGRHLRMISGRVLQDRHSPDGLRDSSATQSLYETEALIARWHGVDRLGYAITPRFAPTSSEAQLRGAGELAAAHPDVWVQSRVAENADEIRWVAKLFPHARSYLGVYEDMGLLRERSVYAHCLHLDANDRDLMAERGAAGAVCPTSNLFLDSGFFDFSLAQSHQLLHALASDVGGGTSFSPFHTMHAAYTVARQSVGQNGRSLSAQHLWWLHTAGAAKALGLSGVTGNLNAGCEADFIVLNPQATPLLSRRIAAADSLQEQQFAMIVLGDDRLVEHVVVDGHVLEVHASHSN
ncbi:MAG: guanine deaminase [Limnohabitans sp.]|nr:guanine deaminase [Limnohabitans sp.]